MDRAKSDAPLETVRRKSRRPAKNGIWNHALIAIAVSIAGLAAAAALLWWQFVVSGNDDHRNKQVALLATTYTGYFNGQIAEITNRVGALASAQEVVDALISNDQAQIDRISAELTEQHGYAMRVQIIPKGRAETDTRGAAPISFAALNLILRAEKEPFVGPEISRTQEQLVFFAQPILHDGVVRGVLFLALDKKGLFFDPLTHMAENATLGQVRIIQNIKGSGDTNVFEFGNPGSGTHVVRTPLASPNWTLTFDPKMESIAPVNGITQILMALAVLAGFVLAGISLSFSSLSRKLQADADTLSAYTVTLLRGRSASVDRYRLPLFQQIASSMGQFGRKGRPRLRRESDSSAEDLLDDKPAPRKKPGKAAKSAPASDSDVDADVERDDLLEDSGSYLEVNVAEDASENFGIEVSEQVGPLDMGLELSPEIFRAYDIRGITTRNLTEDVVYWIGRSFAGESRDAGQERVAVGRDGRHSSLQLKDALVRGLTEGGVDVIDIGEVPTPLLYFATHALDTGTGIMITGSHNPPEYNGLKMMIGGVTLAEERIQAIRQRIEDNRLPEGDSEGDVEEMDLADHYLDRILEDVVVAQPCKVVVDCGNGVAGHIAPRLIEELGCEVVPLYCNVDGDFPNHHPDPADPANLQDLIAVVKDEGAAIGLAFDGDGDRLGVVTASGEIVWPDRLLMLFAQDIVGRNPGADIIFDVKCSRHLNNLVSEYGGRPIMWRTGHSHMKAKLKETGALLAGEFSGHICFGERWFGFDDALYSAARLLEIIGGENKTVDELFGQFPVTYATPELKIEVTEQSKFDIIDKLTNTADFGDGAVTDIDGVRVDFADGWGLIRASNTSPVLSLRFEADEQSGLDRIQRLFQAQLAAIDPKLKFI